MKIEKIKDELLKKAKSKYDIKIRRANMEYKKDINDIEKFFNKQTPSRSHYTSIFTDKIKEFIKIFPEKRFNYNDIRVYFAHHKIDINNNTLNSRVDSLVKMGIISKIQRGTKISPAIYEKIK